jgi:hypothetical protein
MERCPPELWDMILPCVEHHDETCRALAGVSRAVRATTCAMRWRHLRIVGSVQILGFVQLVESMPHEPRPVVNLFLADTNWDQQEIEPEQWIPSVSASTWRAKLMMLSVTEKKNVQEEIDAARRVMLNAIARILEYLADSLRKLAISMATSSAKMWLPAFLPRLEHISWHLGESNLSERLRDNMVETVSLNAPNLASLHLASKWYRSILEVRWIYYPGIPHLKAIKLSMPHETLHRNMDELRRFMPSLPIQDLSISTHPPRPSLGGLGLFNGIFGPEPLAVRSPTAVVDQARTILSASGKNASVTYDDPLQFVRKDDVR